MSTDLSAGEVKVITFSLDLAPSAVESLERVLSPDEVARAEKLRLPRDRRRFVVGRAGTRRILADHVKKEASHLRFQYGPNGKPALADAPQIRFNMSGSHGLGILAIRADYDVGVDLERTRPLPTALSLAERNFTPEESRALGALSGDELEAAFFSLWTRREALLKCLGCGLSHPSNAFSLISIPAEPAEQTLVHGPDGLTNYCVVSLPAPEEGYVAALATQEALPRVRCFSWDPAETGDLRLTEVERR